MYADNKGSKNDQFWAIYHELEYSWIIWDINL